MARSYVSRVNFERLLSQASVNVPNDTITSLELGDT